MSFTRRSLREQRRSDDFNLLAFFQIAASQQIVAYAARNLIFSTLRALRETNKFFSFPTTFTFAPPNNYLWS